MKKTQSIRIVACAVFLATAWPGSIYGRQYLAQSVPAAAARLAPVGNLDPSRQLEFTVMLPHRNQDALNQLVAELYDPASPNYRHFLSLEEFTDRFGPTSQDYQAVLDFVVNNGLTISATYPGRNVLAVKGSVADIQRVLHTTIRTYPMPSENRTCFAPDTAPSVDLDVPLLEIDGLDNFGTAQYHYTSRSLGFNAGPGGSGPGSTYWGLDFQHAYGVNANLTGAGQIVGLFQYDGYFGVDITNYFNNSGLHAKFPYVPLQNVLLDSVSGIPGYSGVSGAVGEVSLDIEMSIAMAPGLSNVVVFEGSAIPPIQILTAMTTRTDIKQFSSSWTWSGGPASTGVDSLLQQLITQGQSYFQASGDSCAYTSTIDSPSSITVPATSTNVISVGATTLTVDANTNFVSETVWNWGGGTGSSGGISTFYNIPPWQQGISMTLNQGSTTKRNIPDVAMVGDNIYVIHDSGSVGSFGGTSCAAPLWAAFTALVNQSAVSTGHPTVGFISPAIYAISKSGNYLADFHDVTTGNNFNAGSPSLFSAVAGLDLCTGLGSPNGAGLIAALVSPDVMSVSPGTGFSATGNFGGPFSPTSQIFTITNSAATNITWSLTGLPSWLSATASGGTLVGHSTTNVTVNLTGVANTLGGGTYTGSGVFNNVSSGNAQPRTFTLTVVVPELVQNGGFETGDFSFWSLSGDYFQYSAVSPATLINGTTPVSPHSGSFMAILATTGPDLLGFMQQDLATVPGQLYLVSFWYNSTDGSTPNDLQAVWGGSQLTNIINGPMAWTNFRKVVLATNTITTLKFAFQDDPSWVAVDDISVQAVPRPTIVGSTNNPGSFSFTWSTTPGAKYQVQASSALTGAWSNLGGLSNAVGTTLTYTDPKTNQLRFYRVGLSP